VFPLDKNHLYYTKKFMKSQQSVDGMTPVCHIKNTTLISANNQPMAAILRGNGQKREAKAGIFAVFAAASGDRVAGAGRTTSR